MMAKASITPLVSNATMTRRDRGHDARRRAAVQAAREEASAGEGGAPRCSRQQRQPIAAAR
jgi:hypothetical protein